MFLNLLNEEEKKAFLRLAVLMAASDGHIADEEKELIGQYAYECQYQDYLYDTDTRDLGTALQIFRNSSQQVKKTVLIELAALSLSDKIYKAEEEKLLQNALDTFALPEGFLMEAITWVKKINTLYQEAASLINT